MGQVTGGRVTYSRTVKTGDFENKKVEVELTFTVADDSDHADILALVGRQAQTKAEEMLGLRSGGSTAAGKSTPVETTTAAEPPKPRGRLKAAAKPEPEPAPEADEFEGEPEAEETDEWESEAAEPEVEELTEEAVLKMVSAQATKTGNNKGIRELIAKFSATGKVAGIPADKRAKFVAALEKIKPAK